MKPDTRTQLDALLATRILVLDGAMGTMIQRHQLTEADFRGERLAAHSRELRGNNDLLVLTRPTSSPRFIAVSRGRQRHHRDQHLQQHGDRAGRLRPRTARLRAPSRGQAGEGRLREWTAHARSPALRRRIDGATNRILSISPDVNNPAFRAMTFDQLREAYKEQARGLIDGGCDVLLLETIVDTLNAKAGIVAIEEVFEEKGVRLPLMISATITDRSGRTLSGQTIDAFWVSIAHARPFSVGINCALGARDMRPYLAELARIAGCYVSCYPNAGLPNAFGQYDERPGDTGGYLREFATSGFVNIVGGCCGTPRSASRRLRRASRATPRRMLTSEFEFRMQFSARTPHRLIPTSR
jgi:5-methyltetrahydrofolate--homocysteine methyltransferase